ncbi:branched-chain amino acid transport system II carrier protein [Leptotrichia sp. OH3620_COT-345]|uniref:branched-chain amino acid transport system II carrier protein n=1 Tax=Leptotrichia sp. OH3620_COT-345 TaxID=2491048 RepID=UPI000F64A8E1|nr:branched-chain amino acid transport system II carrier protein [Leptotrichia sp. OH3620_COT-345]RRD38748.1 branched-chain amino acid transport system II carrier protein [Leptotrichia sp. OH3620_COT-345]
MKKKELIMIGLMIFSLFFGAGNLIFPPIIGKEAGTNMPITMIFFAVTAIIFPVLGIIAVAKSNGLKNLAGRVDSVFAIVFTVATYLAIGPALAMPRAGTVPFEIAIAPYLPEGSSVKTALFIYTTIFFGVVYWLSLNPNKLLDRISKITSPVFLILIFMLFLGTFIKPMGNYAQPSEIYSKNLGLQGFLDGYLTLDALAALNYGLVVVFVIKSKNIIEEGKITKTVITTGIFAGMMLFIVYMMLAHVGASSASMFPHTKNGAEILANTVRYSYGDFGGILLASIFTIACLNIGVGLTTSLSQYFNLLIKKVPYKIWATIWVIWSYILANMGLNKIMEYSVPVLLAIYPASLVLIMLALLDKWIKGNTIIYKAAVYPTVAVSIISTLDKIGISVPLLTVLAKKLPLHNADLGWISVTVVSFIVSFCIVHFSEENK